MNDCPEYEELCEIYNVQKELGSGTFGIVYSVHKKSAESEKYAVKVMERKKMEDNHQDPDNEINIMKKLNYAKIVRFFQAIQGNTYIFLVLEFVPGGDLFDDIDKWKSYTELDASYCMHQILDAINYCHTQRIVHRDLKPENVLLVTKGKCCTIKLTDFGLSIELGEDDERDTFGRAGTKGFYAPEVLNKEVYGKPVDIWACGVMLYILLTGKDPFLDNDATIRGSSEPLERIKSKFSLNAEDLIGRMLKMNQYERITSGDSIMHRFFYPDRKASAEVNLASAVENMKAFNAKRKFRAAVKAVVASMRFPEQQRKKRFATVNSTNKFDNNKKF